MPTHLTCSCPCPSSALFPQDVTWCCLGSSLPVLLLLPGARLLSLSCHTTGLLPARHLLVICPPAYPSSLCSCHPFSCRRGAKLSCETPQLQQPGGLPRHRQHTGGVGCALICSAPDSAFLSHCGEKVPLARGSFPSPRCSTSAAGPARILKGGVGSAGAWFASFATWAPSKE